MNSAEEINSDSCPADIVIVGCGIAGLCSAWRLRETKIFKKIIMVSDPNDQGASALGTGLSLVKGQRIARDPLFKLKYQGHYYLRDLLNEIIREDPDFSYSEGVIEPFTSVGEYSEITRRVFSGQFQAPFGTNLLPRGLIQSGSLFSNKIRGSLVYPQDIWFDLRTMLHSMKKILKNDPSITFIDQRVSEISPVKHGGYFDIKLGSHFFLKTRFLVLCAGGGIIELLNMLGVDNHQYQLSENLGKCFVFSKTTQKNDSCTITFNKGNALCFPQEMRVYGKSFDDANELNVIESLENYLEMKNWNFKSVHCAIRMRSKNRLPICEPLKLPAFTQTHQVFLISGLYRNGVQLADLLARKLVTHVIQEKNKL